MDKKTYNRCVEACRKIFIKIDYFSDWCAGEADCQKAVQKISKGKISYFQPMTEALRDLGVDV
jgi:hypothetical protein